MADQRIGNRMGVAATNVDSGAQRSNLNGSTSVQGEHDDTDYASITALRSRLQTIDSGFYTDSKLNTMTYNDMVYAVRVNDSVSTI